MLKAHWQQMNSREQQLVIGTAIAVLVFILYSLIWQPLNDSLVNADKRIIKQQALLSYVQKNAALYQQYNNSGSKKSTGSLSSIVNRSASSQSIKIDRIQQQGEGLQVWIDEVAFNELASWLEKLTNQQGLVVQSLDLRTTDRPGVVSVRRLQLGR